GGREGGREVHGPQVDPVVEERGIGLAAEVAPRAGDEPARPTQGRELPEKRAGDVGGPTTRGEHDCAEEPPVHGRPPFYISVTERRRSTPWPRGGLRRSGRRAPHAGRGGGPPRRRATSSRRHRG